MTSAAHITRVGVGGLVLFELGAFLGQKQLGIVVSREIAVGLLLTAIMAWLLVEVLEAVARWLPLLVAGMTGLSLGGDAIGNLWGWYERYDWFDSVEHFVSGLAGAVVMMVFFDTLRWRRGWVAADWLWVYVSWTSALAAGVGFEIVEFCLDYIEGVDRWLGSGRDTVADLVMGMLGAVVGVVAVKQKEVIQSATKVAVSGRRLKILKSVGNVKQS